MKQKVVTKANLIALLYNTYLGVEINPVCITPRVTMLLNGSEPTTRKILQIMAMLLQDAPADDPFSLPR